MYRIQDPAFNWVIKNLDCVKAWEVTKGSGVVVAVLDAGINQKHELFQNNITKGYSFVMPLGNDIAALHQHGQSTASCVRAIAPEAIIMPVRVSTGTNTTSTESIVKGIRYAADNGASIISASYFGIAVSPLVEKAAMYARSKGCLVVMASGNTGAKLTGKNFPSIIVTAGSTEQNQIWSKSTFGECVDIATPCEKVGLASITPNVYGTGSGTSYAAPILSGLLALIRSVNKNSTLNEIENILFESCTPIPNIDTLRQGAGIPNAYAAVKSAEPVESFKEEPETGIKTEPASVGIIARILALFSR